MAAKSNLTKEEFITQFKLEYSLMVKNKKIMRSFKSYKKASGKLRSQSVRTLKELGFDGKERSRYNRAIQGLSKASHLKYLFYKNPTCGICGFLIESIRHATIDHITPTSRGGANAIYNKQLAHGPCNVAKGNKLKFKFEKVVS